MHETFVREIILKHFWARLQNWKDVSFAVSVFPFFCLSVCPHGTPWNPLVPLFMKIDF
jgi:hypothetical protein